MQKNSGWLDYQKLKLISAKMQHNYGNISVLGTHHWSLFPAVSTVYQALVAQTERNLENKWARFRKKSGSISLCVQYVCTMHMYTCIILKVQGQFSFPVCSAFWKQEGHWCYCSRYDADCTFTQCASRNPARKNKAKCPGTVEKTPAEGSAKAPLRLRRYLICRHSAGIVAALGALSTSMMHIPSFYPSLCPMLFNFKVIAFPCVATKAFFSSSPPYAAFLIAHSSPKHQWKPLSGMQKRILITDISRSCNTAQSLSLRSPQAQ